MKEAKEAASEICRYLKGGTGCIDERPRTFKVQAMTNYFDLNMENNMRMRDTQFFGMFCLKTVENQIKC
jgi:hypothetical protein